jgi:tRNA dimethylallyltransferase
MSSHTLPAIAILGPTASGKSALGLDLAAKGLPVEIISLDSALVFKDMDIGTAKPTESELKSVPHHLVNIISPTEVYNASEFVQDCLTLIEQIRVRGKVPIILGGTMMYYKALTDGIDDMPDRDPLVRQVIEQEAQLYGWPHMHALLSKVDPLTARRLKPNDSQRIERALEVYRISGKPISFFQNANQRVKYSLPTLTLLPGNRSVLHQRIEQRFMQMLDMGFIQEVISLRQKYPLQASMPSMRCVGYRQVWQYLESQFTYDEMVVKAVVATRQLAKRQLTWLRSIPNQTQIDPQQDDWFDWAMQWLYKQITSLLPKTPKE